MKSLRYMICGKPTRLSDCLDLARRHRPIGVRLELLERELVGEFVTGRQLVASFRWQWKGLSVACEEVCGFRDALGDADEQAVQRKANRKLERHISAIEALDVPVEGRGRRFGGVHVFAA
ncbi:MAG: hypothetical protein ACP5HU_03850 [Phycisphaerae bacterium]